MAGQRASAGAVYLLFHHSCILPIPILARAVALVAVQTRAG